MNFLLKLLRNAGILAGLMLVSTYSTQTLNYELIKPIIIFFIGYVLTELSIRYKLHDKRNATTLIF